MLFQWTSDWPLTSGDPISRDWQLVYLECVDLDLARCLDIEMNLVSTHQKINDKYMKENSYLPDNLILSTG